MRFIPLALIWLSTAPLANADQLDKAIAVVRANPLAVQWQDESDAPVPSLSMKLTAPGRLILTRQVKGQPAHRYAVEIANLYRAKVRSNLRIKSTSCPGVGPTLSCHLRAGVSSLEFNLRPLDGGPDLNPIAISSAAINDALIASALPEMAHASAAALACNDWNWGAHAETKRLEIQDVGLIFDVYSDDLKASAPTNLQLGNSRSCDVTAKRSCDVTSPLTTSPVMAMAMSIPLASWYLELDRGSAKSCTIQFQSESDTLNDLILSGDYYKASAQILSPADRVRIQNRLSPSLIEAWIKDEFARIFEGNFLERIGREEQVMIVQEPWLRLFQLTNNVSTKGIPGPDGMNVTVISTDGRVTEKR